MKNMNRIEIKNFVRKYFKEYEGDIMKISYINHEKVTEYLINNHYLFRI